ncbi:transcriptional regulator, MarR family [Aeromicrobium marinum DSM 15272]|uniref:Transcriptional regulator, MarR family n=1 Tax=Aeromicrobium marinum DSM 15272 TaxID=585531 RepID=E2SFN4_9ACTN|nr:MarR family winged helix-turn-helix transcriptional regulator [Aeromicrobium marinum]EFQ82001.1 transcriptional regulator, MarR family [Aeromicrobium marinum DSM 15272]
MADPRAPGDPSPLSVEEEAAWRALARAVLVIPRVVDADLTQAYGISGTEYTILMYLSEAPETSLRMSQLANYVSISVSGLTRAVGRLEREGLVKRVRCSEDGRGQVAVITPAGMTCLRDAWPAHLRSVREHVMDHLQDIDLVAFAAAMRAVAWPEIGPPLRSGVRSRGDEP